MFLEILIKYFDIFIQSWLLAGVVSYLSIIIYFRFKLKISVMPLKLFVFCLALGDIALIIVLIIAIKRIIKGIVRKIKKYKKM